MLSSIIHHNLEPCVIDLDLLKNAVLEQGPKGEAGKFFASDGIRLDEIENIRLEFLNIFRIDHLWMMTSLVKLQIGNNIIERIENLHMLTNLRELDLSFNNITVIENIESLVNLEVLTMFANHVTKLENLETLTKLEILSIGNNDIEDSDNVLYLRQFEHLRSLNLSGNPCYDIPNFYEYIQAFLPQLVYNEYSMITVEEKEYASDMFGKELEKLQHEESKLNLVKRAEEKEAAEVEFYSVAFIEYLNSDQLFQSLFAKDDYGQALLTLGTEAMEIYSEFEAQFALLTADLFRLGEQQHEVRQEELRQFYDCVNTAKLKSQEESQEWTERFLEKKTKIFGEIRKLLDTVHDSPDDEIDQTVERMQRLTDDFHNLCQSTWGHLMNKELTLYEQLEETNGNFERNLTDVVNVFVEAAQGLFVQCRNLELEYNEQLTEVAGHFLTHLTLDSDMPVPEQLKPIMIDKESVSNALSTSHDMHLQVIDLREDRLVTRIRTWASTLCTNLVRDEIKRDRSKVMEINHFLDVQREEFDEIQTLPI